MQCVDCKNLASFFCKCSDIYLCEDHLGRHLMTKKKHSHEQLYDYLSNPEKTILKKELQKRIKTIQKAINDIHAKVNDFILQLEGLEKKTIKNLNAKLTSYFNLLTKTLLTKQEVREAKEIIEIDLDLNSVGEIEGIQKCKKFFNQQFLEEKYFERRKEAFKQEHNTSFTYGAVSKSNFLVTGCEDGSVRKWDLNQKSQVSYLGSHKDWVNCLIIVEILELAITGSADRTIILWDLKSNSKAATLRSHKMGVLSLAASKNASTLISGGHKEILLWNLPARQFLKRVKVEEHCNFLLYSKNFDKVFCAIEDNIRVWTENLSSKISNMSVHTERINCLALTSDEAWLLSASDDKTIGIWSANDYAFSSVLEGSENEVNSLFITKDDQLVVSGSGDGVVRIWNLNSRYQIHVLKYHKDSVLGVILCNDTFVSLSRDATIALWDLDSKSLICDLHKRQYTLDSEMFTDDGTLVGYGLENRAVIWDLIEKKEVLSINENSGKVLCIAVSKTKDFAVFGVESSKKNLIYLELQKKSGSVPLNGHKSAVNCVSISSDSRLCVSGSEDETVRLWDVRKKKKISKLKGHSAPVKSAEFTQDCKFVVSGGDDQEVIIWDVANRNMHASLSTNLRKISKVIITCDDEQAILCDYIGEEIAILGIRDRTMGVYFKSMKNASEWFRTRQREKELVGRYLF